MIRKIIHIDEEKCNGCGLCARACHEGAIDIVDGKAKLMRENFCDGFGDCLPNCPMGAITFEEREAPEYDAAAVAAAKVRKDEAARAQANFSSQDQANFSAQDQVNFSAQDQALAAHSQAESGGASFSGCPGSRMRSFMRRDPSRQASDAYHGFAGQAGVSADQAAPERRYKFRQSPDKSGNVSGEEHFQNQSRSRLGQWPVQIRLLPTHADFFHGAKLLIAADCTAYAYANMHEEFIKDHVTLVGCPKLDPVDYTEKLTAIIAENDIKSVTIVRMEVPCCGGLQRAAENALRASGKFLPWRVVTISCEGEIIDD